MKKDPEIKFLYRKDRKTLWEKHFFENIVRKGENAGKPAFSPFPTMFSKVFSARVSKIRDCVVKG